MEPANHEIRNGISHGKENRHTDDEVNDIASQPCLQGHGDTGQELQVAKGMQAQMDDAGHGKRTSLKHRIYQVQWQCAEHEHEF